MEMDVQALINSGKPVRIPQSRKEKIEAELKLLEWHKMANAAAIKGALLQTKNTKANSPQKAPQHAQDDERWIKRVIKEEHTRPLNVAKDFVLEYEEKEKINADRLTHQVDRHISTLKTLRSKLESRHDLKTRTEEYRAWQRGFLPKKHAVMIGKTLEEYEASLPPKTANLSDPDAEIDDEAMRKSMVAHNKNATSQELSTVLDSLSRLADLEQRIAGLEKENKYDKMREMENPGGANQRTSIEFRKKRQLSDKDGPVGITYQIRPKAAPESGPWNVQVPVGGASNAVRAYRQNGRMGDDSSYDDGEGGGTFITAQGGHVDHAAAVANREMQKRERARQLELASAGQKALRGRLQDKRARAKEQMLGAKKHEAAMKEMARRKNENSRKPTKLGIGAAAQNKVVMPTRGMGAGIKTKNKHLQEFENLKTSYRKKKEAKERKTYAQEASGVGKRFVSQTAPAYDNKNHPQYRVPNTKGGGTVTRRTDQPTRRGQNGAAGAVGAGGAGDPLSRLPSTAPAIAVTGLGGLRVLKAANQNAPAKKGVPPRR